MKTKAALTILTAVFLGSTTAAVAQPVIHLNGEHLERLNKFEPRIIPNAINPRTLPKAGFVDLAVQDMSVKVDRSYPGGSADLSIILNVKNVGTVDFVSNEGQQVIQLLSRTWTWSLLANEPLPTTIRAGEMKSFLFRGVPGRWNPGTAIESSFLARLAFDPDIRMDSNPENDDARKSNNSATLTRSDINARIHR